MTSTRATWLGVTAPHPRPNFRRQVLQAFTDGIAPEPETAFGNVKDDVLAHFAPALAAPTSSRHSELALAGLSAESEH